MNKKIFLNVPLNDYGQSPSFLNGTLSGLFNFNELHVLYWILKEIL